jgi:lactate dehydrogenase-like 2-hydroxyacid dehydrogenase
MTKANVFVTRKLPDAVFNFLSSRCNVEMYQQEGALSREELLNKVQGRDAVLIVGDVVDEAVCQAAKPTCRLFANYGVGYNNIDVAAAGRHGIYVSNTPDVVTNATADLAWALLLAVSRRLVEGGKFIKAGGWKAWNPLLLLGSQVSGKTVGIIGAGRIGAAFAQRARGFNMNILYTAHSAKSEFAANTGSKYVSLTQLLQKSDYITLHVPLTPETRHLIGARELAMMKPTAFLINTARGAVVDEKALVNALRSGTIAGAGLDVFENEPAVEPGLLELDNVVLTPHVGTSTLETRGEMGRVCAENIFAVLDGQQPTNWVNYENFACKK